MVRAHRTPWEKVWALSWVGLGATHPSTSPFSCTRPQGGGQHEDLHFGEVQRARGGGRATLQQGGERAKSLGPQEETLPLPQRWGPPVGSDFPAAPLGLEPGEVKV